MSETPATAASAEQQTTSAVQQPQAPDKAVEGTDEGTLLGGKENQETKESEGKEQPAKNVPEKYEIKAPEGMAIDQAMLDTFTPIFKELGISQEGAQKLADAYAPVIKQQMEAQQQAAINEYKTTVENWKSETTKALGANADKELAKAAKAIEKFGSPELRQVLNETGVGNHIHLVRFFAKVGELISQDSFVDSKYQKTASDPTKTLYPTMNQ